MPDSIKDETAIFEAFERLNSEARQTETIYRNTIAKSCITVMSAIIAIIGFLISSHETKILFTPISGLLSLYVIFAGFGLSYAMAIISIKYQANYLSAHSELTRHKILDNKEESTHQKLLRDKAKNMTKFVSRTSEISAIIGLIGLLLLGVILVRNLDINYSPAKSTISAKNPSYRN